MAANTQPIFPVSAKASWVTMTTANTAKDGTGTVGTLVTAVAAPTGTGFRVDTIKLRPLGTNVASVLRIFINNGSANSTPANNSLMFEVSLPATTLTEVAALSDIAIVFNTASYASGVTNSQPQLVLPPGYKLNLTVGTTVAAGWQVTVVGGEYSL